MRTERVGWFGYMDRKDENEWISYVKNFEAEGRMLTCKQLKTQDEVMRKDPESKATDRQVPHDCGLARCL